MDGLEVDWDFEDFDKSSWKNGVVVYVDGEVYGRNIVWVIYF